MKSNQRTTFLLRGIVLFSLFSFLYLNFIVSGDSADFAYSNIAVYENVEASALKEFKIMSAALQQILDIMTLNR
jgi:hypothetical protein